MDFFTPQDNEEAKRKPTGGYWGACGPAAIAALMRMEVYQIMQKWPGKYKGWAPMADMQVVLENLKIPYVRMRGLKARKLPRPDTGCAIARIQWLQDNGKEYYWAAATIHTHYVLMVERDGRWWCFCNGKGWFLAQEEEDEYLKLGYVSSYLKIFLKR